MAVAPEARGQGGGGALVRECIRRAHEAGAAAIMSVVCRVMAAAMRPRVNMGFVRAPEMDRQPMPEVLIKSYRFHLTSGDFTAASTAA